MWHYDGQDAFLNPSICTRRLGQFEIDLVSVCDGVATSRAAINVSSTNVSDSVIGTVIECGNTSVGFESNITINLKVNRKYCVVISTWDILVWLPRPNPSSLKPARLQTRGVGPWWPD